VTSGLTAQLKPAVTCGLSRDVNSGVKAGFKAGPSCCLKSGLSRAVTAQVRTGIPMRVPEPGLTMSQAPLQWRDAVRNRPKGTVPGA
jgi:hypothetical protein